MITGARTQDRWSATTRRTQLRTLWTLAHTEIIECEPGCTQPKVDLTSCAGCRAVVMGDRAAW